MTERLLIKQVEDLQYMREAKMFCVIQELTTKRENPLGFPKRLESTQESVRIEDGTEQIKWGYAYSDECFERPVKKSYKVSVHQSYRDKDGKPRKKEFVLFTVKYYDLTTGEFDTYNWGADKIEKVAAILIVIILQHIFHVKLTFPTLIFQNSFQIFPICLAFFCLLKFFL